MPKYIVTMPIAGSVSLEVECASEDEAEDAFFETIDAPGFDLDRDADITWEYLTEITSGNVCHAPTRKMDIEEVPNDR